MWSLRHGLPAAGSSILLSMGFRFSRRTLFSVLTHVLPQARLRCALSPGYRASSEELATRKPVPISRESLPRCSGFFGAPCSTRLLQFSLQRFFSYRGSGLNHSGLHYGVKPSCQPAGDICWELHVFSQDFLHSFTPVIEMLRELLRVTSSSEGCAILYLQRRILSNGRAAAETPFEVSFMLWRDSFTPVMNVLQKSS